jgi:FMN reductase
MAGATKNMLDFIEYMHDDEIPFLHNRPVGLIAVAGGTMASVSTIAEFIHAVHALRGVVVPLTVPIHQGRKNFSDGSLTDEGIQKRLTAMAQETVRLSRALKPAVAGV